MKKIYVITSIMGGFLLTSLLNCSYASEAEVVNYSAPTQHTFNLEKIFPFDSYRVETYEDTCTKQVVVGHDRVCKDVNRTRRECEDVPVQRCENVRESYNCRNVTRHRRECSTGPNNQQISTVPSRQECSPGPIRRVCTPSPPRQQCRPGPSRRVCTTQPTRQVCNRNPRTGENVCRTVGGGQSCRNVPGPDVCRTVSGGETCRNERGPRVCRTVPGRRTCRTVPGQQVCRDVPYSERTCDYRDRQQCRTENDRQCKNVPYVVNECNDVPRHETKEYTCEKERKIPEVKEHHARRDVQLNFIGDHIQGDLQFEVKVLDNKQVGLRVLENENNHLVFLVDRDSNVIEEDELASHQKTHYNVRVVDRSEVKKIGRATISDIQLVRSQNALVFQVDKDPQGLNMVLGIKRKRKSNQEIIKIDQKKDYIKVEKLDSGSYQVSINLDNKDYPRLAWLRRYDVDIELMQSLFTITKNQTMISGEFDEELLTIKHTIESLKSQRR